MGIYKIEQTRLEVSRFANNEFWIMSISLHASYLLSIGLKTIIYCHSSHMRTIVT